MKKIIKVIIPAFNEEKSISRVINDIPKELVDEVIVVNNASTDDTEKMAIQAGATVIGEKKAGYGAACLRGLSYLSEQGNQKPDIVVFIDGDYSDYPEEMIDLVQPILHEKADLVIGSRALGEKEKGSMTIPQVVGNKIATTLLKWLYNTHFTDLGPFRAIKYESLLSLEMKDQNYGWTVEMQLKAARQNLKCVEIPVRYRNRIGFSKISGTVKGTILAGYKIIWTIIKYL